MKSVHFCRVKCVLGFGGVGDGWVAPSRRCVLSSFIVRSMTPISNIADLAQLGERQTEDLKVPGSIPGVGTPFYFYTARRAED